MKQRVTANSRFISSEGELEDVDFDGAMTAPVCADLLRRRGFVNCKITVDEHVINTCFTQAPAKACSQTPMRMCASKLYAGLHRRQVVCTHQLRLHRRAVP